MVVTKCGTVFEGSPKLPQNKVSKLARADCHIPSNVQLTPNGQSAQEMASGYLAPASLVTMLPKIGHPTCHRPATDSLDTQQHNGWI